MRACLRACLLVVAGLVPAASAMVMAPRGLLAGEITGIARATARAPAAVLSEPEGDKAPIGEVAPAEPAPAADTQPAASGKYQFDLDKSGAGFNQFDPVLWLSVNLSRRFGIFGGLILVAGLAATEGNEILKGITDTGPVAGDGVAVTTASGLQYTEVLISSSGDVPMPGSVIGFDAKVTVGDRVLFDTKDTKPVAFKYGQRPFQNVVCEGVEEGIKGMHAGGKRIIAVPAALAPPGVNLPPGVPLVYELTLTEVLKGYF